MEKVHQIKLNLLQLSWPIFIEELTGGLVTLTDTLFLCMLSDKVAASIGMLGSVLMLGFFIIPQFSGAGTSVASQYMGAKQDDHVVPTYIGNLAISVAMGTFLSLALFALSGKIGLWLGLDSEQNGYAAEYLSIMAFIFILVGARFAYASILASKTLTGWNMITSVVGNILNVVLKFAFIKGFWLIQPLGIKGIALASVISFGVGLLMLLYLVHIRLKISFWISDCYHRVKKVVGPILKIGIPSALEPFSYTIQSFVVSVLIIKLGLIAMSANTYINRLIFLDLTVSWSLTTAGQIIMSHYLGAGALDKVNRTYRRIIVISAVFAFVNILIYLIGHNYFLSFFTHDPAIKSLGFWILLVCLFMEPIRAVNILGGVALKIVGDGKFSATMGIIFMWGLIPVIILASNLGTGIIGLWVVLLLDETIRAGINLWRWYGGGGIWRKGGVIERTNQVGAAQ